MTKNQFIERQIYYSLQKGKEPRSVIASVFTAVGSQSEADKALEEYDKTKSISHVLQSLGIVDIDESFLPILKEIETEKSTSESIATILESKQLIKKTISLMKARLNIGLSYALMLVLLACLVLYVTSGGVLDNFESFFIDTGASLPQFTQFVINWQNSYFGPQLIALILIIVILFFLFITKRSNEKVSNLAIFAKLPFLNHIFHFTNNLNWLTQLKLLVNANYSLDSAKIKLSKVHQKITDYSPQLSIDLANAEKLGNLAKEIEYQLENVAMNAELIVTKACRNLVATIMVFVVSFVAMTLIASYLPIFHLGAVV